MDMIKIGRFLAELRKEKNMTQTALGEALGVTNKTVSRWENGNYLPPVEMLMLLSQLHGVTINELLSGRRLDDSQYREYAEENMKAALAQSSFTLKEKMDFFKRKWKKEHISGYVLAVLAAAALYAAGVWLDNGVQIAAFLWVAGFVVVQNNRMMAYVEDRAFDGSGRQ